MRHTADLSLCSLQGPIAESIDRIEVSRLVFDNLSLKSDVQHAKACRWRS